MQFVQHVSEVQCGYLLKSAVIIVLLQLIFSSCIPLTSLVSCVCVCMRVCERVHEHVCKFNMIMLFAQQIRFLFVNVKI